MAKKIDNNKLAKYNKKEIKRAVNILDKYYWALNEKDENIKDKGIHELLDYCKQFYEGFEYEVQEYKDKLLEGSAPPVYGLTDEEGWTPVRAYCMDCEEYSDENGKHSHILKFNKKLKK